MDDDSADLGRELQALRGEVERLNSHRFIQIQNSWIKLILFQFVRGVAFGLGTLLGASLLLSIVAWALAQVDFIPIIGDWAAVIAREIEAQLSLDP